MILVADTVAWRHRLADWLRRRCIASSEDAPLQRCEEVERMGLRGPLQVIFLDAEGRVQRRVTVSPRRARLRNRA